MKKSRGFNVEDYGAKPDGTDSTVAIQACVDAAEAAGGGIVIFPDGPYLMRGVLVHPNVGIVGASFDLDGIPEAET